MRVISDNLWLCSDCTQIACNGSRGLDLKPEQIRECEEGLGKFSNLVPDFDSESGEGLREFSGIPCASCQTILAGYRARFAELGE